MSPDGLIWNEARRGHGIIEIKCLFSCKDKKIENLSFLDENGDLKKTDKWYTQVCVNLELSALVDYFYYRFSFHVEKCLLFPSVPVLETSNFRVSASWISNNTI